MNKCRHAIVFAVVLVVLAVLAVAPLYAEPLYAEPGSSATASSATASCAAASSAATAAPPADVVVPDVLPSPILASSPPPVNVYLSCSSYCIGDKTRYACTATGSGGYGSAWYSFSWSGANPTSGSGDNPNYAYRVMTPGGPCQDVVQVWLTDGCSTDDASRTIYDYCDSSCKILP